MRVASAITGGELFCLPLVFHYQAIWRTTTTMLTEHPQQNNNAAWVWFVIGVIVVAGWLFFSQAKDKADYNKALRTTGARVECRAEAKREGWSSGSCDSLGMPGYETSTKTYYDAYKSRTGAKEL